MTDEMADNNDGGSSHPLLNTVVLERLFQFCGSEDLPNIRSVCTLWYDVSLSRWRNERTITIDLGTTTLRPSTKSLALEDLVQLQDPSFSEKPFKSYRLKSWIFSRAPMSFPYLAKLEAFFIQCGSWIRELTLIHPEIKCEDSFYKAILELTPNLKSLALIGYIGTVDSISNLNGGDLMTFESDEDESGGESGESEYDDDGDGAIHVQSSLTHLIIDVDPTKSRFWRNEVEVPWIYFYCGFPNLEVLEVRNLRGSEISKLASALQFLGKVKRTSKIKVLNMQDTLLDIKEAKEIVSRSCSHLELEELHLNMNVQYDDMLDEEDHDYYDYDAEFGEVTAISYLLEQQAAILHSLRLSTEGSEDKRFVFMDFLFRVSFESLTKLEFEGNVVHKWDFLRFTPNLKSVSLLKCERTRKNLSQRGGSWDLEKYGVIVPKLEELRVDFYISIELLVFFGKCMPNVSILEAPLTNETFSVVCKNWKEMRELHAVHSDGLGDGGITGFMKGTKCDKRNASIANLKYLRAFSTNSILLSDQSIWNGFLLLPELNLLKVNFSRKTSKEAIAAQMEKVPGFRTLSQLLWMSGY